jgi:hypothetical protein
MNTNNEDDAGSYNLRANNNNGNRLVYVIAFVKV